MLNYKLSAQIYWCDLRFPAQDLGKICEFLNKISIRAIIARISLLIFYSFFLGGCGAMLCSKGKTKQGIFFNFYPEFKTVNIGTYPTFAAPEPSALGLLVGGKKRAPPASRDPYMKKMFVKKNGFLIIHQQRSFHCDNMEEVQKGLPVACQGHRFVNDGYQIRQYTKKSGYKEWNSLDLSKSQLTEVKNFHHIFAHSPDYHYENCRYKIFGGLIQWLQIISSL